MVFLDASFETLPPTGAWAPLDPQNHRLFIKILAKSDEKLEKEFPKGLVVSCRNGFFGRQFRDPAPNRCKAAPGPQNHRFSIKI